MNLLRSSAEGFLQGAGIVQIQHATFFVRLHHLTLTATCPDDRTSARFQRRLHQFVIQVGGENNRMPAPSLVNRQNDGLARGVKSLDQLTHQSRTNKRMVDQEQNHSISFCRNTPQSSLDRTQLPFSQSSLMTISSKARLISFAIGSASAPRTTRRTPIFG